MFFKKLVKIHPYYNDPYAILQGKFSEFFLKFEICNEIGSYISHSTAYMYTQPRTHTTHTRVHTTHTHMCPHAHVYI